MAIGRIFVDMFQSGPKWWTIILMPLFDSDVFIRKIHIICWFSVSHVRKTTSLTCCCWALDVTSPWPYRSYRSPPVWPPHCTETWSGTDTVKAACCLNVLISYCVHTRCKSAQDKMLADYWSLYMLMTWLLCQQVELQVRKLPGQSALFESVFQHLLKCETAE